MRGRSMDSMLMWVVVTALASSGLTLALGFVAWRLWAAPRLDAQLLQAQEAFERRVRAGVLAAGTDLLVDGLSNLFGLKKK